MKEQKTRTGPKVITVRSWQSLKKVVSTLTIEDLPQKAIFFFRGGIVHHTNIHRIMIGKSNGLIHFTVGPENPVNSFESLTLNEEEFEKVQFISPALDFEEKKND